MALPISPADAHRNGAPPTPDRRPSIREDALRAAGLEILADDDRLQTELGRLADESRKVREELEGQLDATASTPGAEALERLRTENERLSHKVGELELICEEMQKEQAAWESRQREYEGLLEEKSEVIRELHRRLHEQPERAAAGGAAPREEELIALSEELERERRQLKDDEETLMQQMRQMEVQMSRERAEMARQRNEFQRLQNDVRHELELAARDATLRDRLAPLQRRHGEMVNRTGGGPRTAAQETAPAAVAEPEPIQEATPRSARKDSSLFRRLFG